MVVRSLRSKLCLSPSLSGFEIASRQTPAVILIGHFASMAKKLAANGALRFRRART
jgi:hypothetical protein